MTLSMIWVTLMVVLVFVVAPAAVATGVIVLLNNLFRDKKLGWVDAGVILFILSVFMWIYMSTTYL